MPRANAPKAPWVEVWLSPQTMVLPGCVYPCSGPMMWTMPWLALSMSYRVIPNSFAFRVMASSCLRDISSAMGWDRSEVGTLWSMVAMVSSGRRIFRPVMRRPSKACGDVTSCTRWRSMYSRVDWPGSSWTTWLSQILSNMVLGMGVPPS